MAFPCFRDIHVLENYELNRALDFALNVFNNIIHQYTGFARVGKRLNSGGSCSAGNKAENQRR
jgi:hypothetical protein